MLGLSFWYGLIEVLLVCHRLFTPPGLHYYSNDNVKISPLYILFCTFASLFVLLYCSILPQMFTIIHLSWQSIVIWMTLMTMTLLVWSSLCILFGLVSFFCRYNGVGWQIELSFHIYITVIHAFVIGIVFVTSFHIIDCWFDIICLLSLLLLWICWCLFCSFGRWIKF